jgi:ribosomal protein S4E
MSTINTIPLKVKKATYLDGFKVFIVFNDGKKNTVDFKEYLDTINNGFLVKYKKPSVFKNFAIENGNLVWGKDWDLIFPVTQLYKGKIKI